MKIEDVLKLWKAFEAQTTELEARELYNAVLFTPQGDVVEVGSATGGTTIVLILAAKEALKMVYSVDPYPDAFENNASDYTAGLMTIYKNKFRQNILNHQHYNIIQLNEDIKNCIDRIPKELSVVFIDGCHEFAYVKNEYDLLFPKLVPGGIMYIHDIYAPAGQLSKSEDQGVSQLLKLVSGEIIGNKMLKIVK